MTVSTQGIELRVGSRTWRSAVELLSSMRFAISLLTLICIASVIGTVLKQNEPVANYVNQFGPFWAEVFLRSSLTNVYSAWWFLLILAFLVVSTSLCVARNTPKILADLGSFKENIRVHSLKAFGHRAQATLSDPPAAAAKRLGELLVSGGWKVKLQSRETPSGAGWMLAAKKGAMNKLGYIAAHSAIVLVCVGGLLDGELMVRAQMLFNGKSSFKGGGMMADVATQHRLSENNPTFRGNLMVTEGTQSGTAILNQADGILLQDLPFNVELKKFIVEYYSTGMPKLFASDIVIHDKATGEKIPARVEVNHPASYKGIEIYQSSFDDGGSALKFTGQHLRSVNAPFHLEGAVGGGSRLTSAAGGHEDELSVEYTGLRLINVENFSAAGVDGMGQGSKTDLRSVDLRASIDAQLGAANKRRDEKVLRNIGPSYSYKLRDKAGQAREFNNYMLPVDLGDGSLVFLLGMRETPSEPFRYLRVPADAEGGLDGFLRLSRSLGDSALRSEAVRRYATKSMGTQRPELVVQLAESAHRALDLFTEGGRQKPGLQAVSDFLETKVPEAERAKAGEVLVRILNGVLFELAQLSREKAGLKPLPQDDATQQFMTQAVLALSDLPLYPAPFVLQLQDFTQVQASVFQVARAPGKSIVYLGCALLILGVFAMLYVRERRLWIWLEPHQDGAPLTSAIMALSTNRKTMDGDQEFEFLKGRLLA